jgi:hypothetical protein
MLKIVLEVLKCAVIVLGAVSGLIGTFTKNKDKPPGKITLAESTMTRPVADAQKALNLLLGAHATLTAADTSRNGRNPPSHSFLAQQNPAGNKTEVKVGDFPDFSHPRAVSPSSEVSSFELDLFMSQIGAKLPDFFERFAHEPMNQGEDDFRTAVLRSIFCSSPRSVQFAMLALPLAQNPNLYLNISVRDAVAGVCAVNVDLMFYPLKEDSPRSQTVDFKLADPMKPASPQVRGDRAVFYIQVESRYLNALKKDELLRYDSFVPRMEPSLVVLCSHSEDSAVVAEHFRRVLPQIVGFNVIPNQTEKDFQSSSVYQLQPDEAVVRNGIVFAFKRVKQSSEWNANQFLAGRD